MFRSSRSYGIAVLIALLFCVYTFTNSGRFHIVDEVSLFAMTESLALRSAVDTNAIAWTQWVNSPGEVLGAFGNDGTVYSKKGPAPAFLAMPWYFVLRLFALMNIEFGVLQGTLLWNGIVTALTAGVLWRVATRLGYNDRTGALLGIFFGVGTIAWPYANHFFGEPLSTLGLITAYYGILTWRQTRAVHWLWLAGVAAGVVIATVTAHILLVAIFELYLFYLTWRTLRERTTIFVPGMQASSVPLKRLPTEAWGAFHFLAPVALAGMLLIWYNAARFGNPLDTGYHFESGEGFTTPIWQGFWGLIGSPYRGIFWHTPLFLASLFAIPAFWRRHRSDAIVIGALSLLLIGLYSTWWMWWGGFAWGPRFLVPLTPFWVLLLAPLLEVSIPQLQLDKQEEEAIDVDENDYNNNNKENNKENNKDKQATAMVPIYKARPASKAVPVLIRSRLPILVLAFALISCAVQVLAVVVNYVNYESELRSIFPTNWSDPLEFGPPAQSISDWLYSPVIGQWRLLSRDFVANSDLAWIAPDGDVNWLIVLTGGLAVVSLLGLLIDWWRWSLNGDAETPGLPLRATLLFIPLLFTGVWLGGTANDPLYGSKEQSYRAVIEEICAQVEVDDSIVTIAPTAYHVPMNWLGARCPIGVPIFGYAADSMNYPEAQAALSSLLADRQRVFFVTGGLQPNAPDNSVERWLAQNAYKADDRWFDDYRLVRYATNLPIEGSPSLLHNVMLTDNKSNQVFILKSQAPAIARPGSVLPVRIEYLLERPVDAELRWFVQLLTQDGTAVALLDTGVEDNYGSFITLFVNQLQVERAALSIPLDLNPGQYRVIAGLYKPAIDSTPRLVSSDGRDSVLLSFLKVE